MLMKTTPQKFTAAMFSTLAIGWMAVSSAAPATAQTLRTVALSEDAAPGTDAGVNFDSLSSPVLNGAGQTAFRAGLTGTGVDGNNDEGIFAEDLLGVLTLIAREGDLLDVDDGIGIDLRTISTIGFSGATGNEDGRASGFNDLGQLVFSASFTDGTSGIFVSNLVAVPEPASLTLLALGGLSLLHRRRRAV